MAFDVFEEALNKVTFCRKSKENGFKDFFKFFSGEKEAETENGKKLVNICNLINNYKHDLNANKEDIEKNKNYFYKKIDSLKNKSDLFELLKEIQVKLRSVFVNESSSFYVNEDLIKDLNLNIEEEFENEFEEICKCDLLSSLGFLKFDSSCKNNFNMVMNSFNNENLKKNLKNIVDFGVNEIVSFILRVEKSYKKAQSVYFDDDELEEQPMMMASLAATYFLEIGELLGPCFLEFEKEDIYNLKHYNISNPINFINEITLELKNLYKSLVNKLAFLNEDLKRSLCKKIDEILINSENSEYKNLRFELLNCIDFNAENDRAISKIIEIRSEQYNVFSEALKKINLNQNSGDPNCEEFDIRKNLRCDFEHLLFLEVSCNYNFFNPFLTFSTHCLLEVAKIASDQEKFDKQLFLKQMVKMMLAHEFGHALDFLFKGILSKNHPEIYEEVTKVKNKIGEIFIKNFNNSPYKDIWEKCVETDEKNASWLEEVFADFLAIKALTTQGECKYKEIVYFFVLMDTGLFYLDKKDSYLDFAKRLSQDVHPPIAARTIVLGNFNWMYEFIDKNDFIFIEENERVNF
jgi:hypothetical protein